MAILNKTKILCQKITEYNDLAVIRKGDTITLWSGDYKQTEIEIKRVQPFRTTLEYSQACFLSLAFHPDPGAILVLGLGGGAIPTLLHSFLEESIIDVVEIDPGVYEIARNYFYFTPSERLRLFIDDAFFFIRDTTNRYDLVIMDTYIENRLPESIFSTAFFAECARILTPGGILAANLMTGNKTVYQGMIENLLAIFNELWLLPMGVSTNTLAFASGKKIPAATLRERAKTLSGQISFDFELYPLLNRLEKVARP